MAALAAVGGVILGAALVVVALYWQFRPVVFLMFLVVLGIAPPLAAGVIHLNDRRSDGWSRAWRAALIVIKSALFASAVGLVAWMQSKAHVWPQPVPLWMLLAAVAVALTVVFLSWVWRSTDLDRLAQDLDAWLVIAVAAAVFMLSPFDPAAPTPIGLVAYAQDAPHFVLWLAAGLAWTAIGIWLRRHEAWIFGRRKKLLDRLSVTAAILFIFSLYDDGHFVDMGHYMPLVGPALNALHGGTAMVDVYSVYGLLPWLVHRAAFEFFSPTFGTAAVVVRLLNVAYLALILAVLCGVSRRRLSAIWFFVPAVLVALTSHNPGATGMWNMNSLPMTLGGRNLLPATMALLLIVGRASTWARWVEFGLIAIASLASVEIFAFTVAPWGYSRLLDAVRNRSVRPMLTSILLACLAVAVAQAALVAGVWISAGKLADYRPYFDLFLQFRPAEDSIWSVSFVPNYALWLPIGLAYFVIMAAAGYRALRRDPADSLVERLLPAAVLGLGPLAYFFGRPQEGTLNIVCLSFSIVAIATAEALFVRPSRFGSVGSALFAVLAAAFVFIVADGLEHFARPPDPSRGNASILRRCFAEGGCRLAEVPRNIGLALHTQPLDPRTQVGYYANEAVPRIEEAILMLRRVAPHAPYVGMLTEDQPMRYADANATLAMVAFMDTGQWFPWRISSPLIDGDSTLLTDRILKRVDATPSGIPIIISNDRRSWVPLNQKILDKLTARCRLVPLETGQYHSAFLTEGCSE